jgi:hypothetical protein
MMLLSKEPRAGKAQHADARGQNVEHAAGTLPFSNLTLVLCALAFVVVHLLTNAHGASSMPELPSIVRSQYSDLTKLSQAELRMFGLRIYNTQLFADKDLGLSPSPDGKPGVVDSEKVFSDTFALDIHYLMNFKREAIAERSVKEMRGQGYADDEQLAKWQQQMAALFPNIAKNDHLIGVYEVEGGKAKSAVFFHKHGDEVKRVGSIDDPKFARAFFEIWLSPKTSQPKLRTQLLTLKATGLSK